MNHNPQKSPITRFLPFAVLFLVAFLIYLKTTGYAFIPIWDDREYVLNNIYIRGLNLENLRYIFTRPILGNYAPLHILSYSLDYAVWGLDPRGYHLGNVILHGLNSMLAYALIRKVTGNARSSFLAALIFAVHPLNVENVAWVSERKTLLTAFFSFTAIIFYTRFSDGRRAADYLLSAAFFLLAILSKPLTVTLPLVLLAYEFFVKGRRGRALLYPVPLFLLSLFGAATTLASHLGHTETERGIMTLSTLFGTIYPTMLTIFWKYLRLMVWPLGLSGFYDTTLYHSFLSPPAAAALLGLAALFIAVLWKGGAQTRFWFLWFWLWLLPVSNLIPIPVYYADRYMYLPAIAFFVLIGSLTVRAARAMEGGYGVRRYLPYAVFTVIFAFYASVAFNRTAVWRNELAFWKDTARKSPALFKPRLNLGQAYEAEGMLDEAEQEYLAAVAIYPDPDVISSIKFIRMKRQYLRRSR
ncbi:MAG: glycosyltransferase family 39 protein [Thermodesulfobacteriota bacterium]